MDYFVTPCLFSLGGSSLYNAICQSNDESRKYLFYMMVTGIILIPFALLMTDFNQPINWGFKGPYLTAIIQILNAVGALTIVYAFRYGKAMVVSPLTNAVAPVITIILSLIIYQVIPHWIIIAGMVFAVSSIFLLAVEDDETAVE